MTDEIAGPASCPDCGEPIDFEFQRPFKDIAHMIINDEYVTLEPFPVLVKCTSCEWRRESMGREFTIDMKAGKVLFGKIDGLD